MPAPSSGDGPAPISWPPCNPCGCIVTRPQPEAERTAAALRRAGHAVEVAALLRIESIAAVELGSGPWSALAVTSANALRALD